jgi:hypothetical protein
MNAKIANFGIARNLFLRHRLSGRVVRAERGDALALPARGEWGEGEDAVN